MPQFWPPLSVDSGWITPTLASGWATPAGNYSPLQYRLVGGRVEMRGAATGATSGDPLFTLPAGFRPGIASGKELAFIVAQALSTSGGTRVVVRANGQVVAIAGTTPSFDQVGFRID